MAKTNTAKAVDINNINIVEIATKAGNAIHLYKAGVEQAEEGLKRFNDAGITLHNAKVTVGKSRRTDSTLQALYDALVAGGIKGNSAANYLTAFRQVVSTGKPIKGFNVSRENSKAGAKTTPVDAGKQADSALRALFNCEMSEFILDTIESAYQDGKGSDPTLRGALKWVMESRGFKFSDDGVASQGKAE